MGNEIMNKIDSLRKEYPFLAKKDADYIFNAVAVQTLFYKNPAHNLDAAVLQKIIVDGTHDGGIDCILTDLESDESDMVFVQCKYYTNFPLEQIKSALDKMYGAYLNLLDAKYSYFRDELVSQYSECQYEMTDLARVKFILCTSAPQSGTKIKSITNYFQSIIGDNTNVTLEIYFEKDIVEKIIEFDSLRRSVSTGTIKIDEANNYLCYSEELDDDCNAIIINGSAWSIKQLYSQHHLALLSKNLRFFVKSKDIDQDVRRSIDIYKKKFWYKNNGITIICENFKISGTEVHLFGFSIINGGQTTTLVGTHDGINEKNDFYIPIKIISIQGKTEEERQKFVFDIAIATNSQKAIKKSDLKANEPEQILFANEIRQKGVFYRTKRGESIPLTYKEKTKNLDLAKASKLGLAGIYLMPGTSRSKPSIIYDENTSFYEGIFVKNRDNSTTSIKDLLYIDNYFDTKFKKEYAKSTQKIKRVTFANNSRTLCLAYAGFLSKYLNHEFNNDQISMICNCEFKDEKSVKSVQKVLSDPSKMNGIFNKFAYENLDVLEKKLYKIFAFVCKQGEQVYNSISQEESVDESNWLKRDVAFYRIIANSFDDLKEEINEHKDWFDIFIK